MKRRREQERDEAIAREQADARREALLAELKARQAAVREPEPPAAEAAPQAAAEAAPEAAAEPADEPDAVQAAEKGEKAGA
jgi:hypothetical protein